MIAKRELPGVSNEGFEKHYVHAGQQLGKKADIRLNVLWSGAATR